MTNEYLRKAYTLFLNDVCNRSEKDLRVPKDGWDDREIGEIHDAVFDCLRKLSHTQSTVMMLLYGLDGNGERTIRGVGWVMGASERMVEDIMDDAFAKLREHEELLTPYIETKGQLVYAHNTGNLGWAVGTLQPDGRVKGIKYDKVQPVTEEEAKELKDHGLRNAYDEIVRYMGGARNIMDYEADLVIRYIESVIEEMPAEAQEAFRQWMGLDGTNIRKMEDLTMEDADKLIDKALSHLKKRGMPECFWN